MLILSRYKVERNDITFRSFSGDGVIIQIGIHDTFLPKMVSYINTGLAWGYEKVSLKHNIVSIVSILVRHIGFFSDKLEYNNSRVRLAF